MLIWCKLLLSNLQTKPEPLIQDAQNCITPVEVGHILRTFFRTGFEMCIQTNTTLAIKNGQTQQGRKPPGI
jgi:hypothetical protein